MCKCVREREIVGVTLEPIQLQVYVVREGYIFSRSLILVKNAGRKINRR